MFVARVAEVIVDGGWASRIGVPDSIWFKSEVNAKKASDPAIPTIREFKGVERNLRIMADGSDPGDVEKYTERQKERVKRQVREPNRTDILIVLRKGERGEIPSVKPNEQFKGAWALRTVQNNARKLRILAGETQGLDEAKYDGIEWDAEEGRNEYPDRLLDFTTEEVDGFLQRLAIEREWSEMVERDYRLTYRNLLLAHDKIDDATKIRYPQTDHSNARVNVETVPTREDLFLMMEGEDKRDKALLAVLWESGCRVTALSALKIKHWTPKGDGYGVVQVPGQHVIGLKGAEYDAKPITFARGYLENWLAEHPLADELEAPLFPPLRSQDDPWEHMSPHSINTHIKRIARRTEGVDAENISPHSFKHGRATEMRASDKYDSKDIEQILDWEEGTPMHKRYSHVTEEDEAERILRKHGYEPEEGGDTVEQADCPRCGTVVSVEAMYCPQCSLRLDDTRPDWWQLYRGLVPEDDTVREMYKESLPPANISQLTPAYYDHVHRVLMLATVPDLVPEEMRERVGFSVPELDEEDKDWVLENLPDIHREQREKHPVRMDND